MTNSPATSGSYVADGQWHHFGPQPAPAMGASSPETATHSQGSAPVQTYSAYVGDGQWHHFGPEPSSAVRPSSPQTAAPRTSTISLAEAR
jgi:hypothetical protein